MSTIAQALKQLQRGTAGGVHGGFSRSGTGGGDSLTRALLAAKGYSHAAGLDLAGQHGAGTGAGAESGIPFEGAGHLPGWKGGGCAEVLGPSRNREEEAAGEGAGWLF